MARPREFDEQAVLEACLDQFWAKGFAAVSMSDLEGATGLGRQSLYSAFGDKRALFAAVLERYAAATEIWLAPLLRPEAGLAELRRYAKDALAAQRAHGAHGCLVVKTLWDRDMEDSGLIRRAAAAAQRVREAFGQALERSAERGELLAGDSEQRANLCFATLNGLAALRRSGVSEAEALALFEQLIEPWRSSKRPRS